MSSCSDSLIEEICSSQTLFLLTSLQLLSFRDVAGSRVHASVSFEEQLGSVFFFSEGVMTRLQKRCSEGWSPCGTAGLFLPGAGGILRRKE